MRKSREEAAETRKQIVTAASREFRANGVVATGLADLMKAAGLTHGGFYKHFESKDQLIAEAIAEAVDALIDDMSSRPDFNATIGAYLSARHRDNPSSGCPLSAIGSELSRADAKARDVATDGFRRLVDVLAGKSKGKDARRRALVAASAIIGAVTMARVVSDPELSEEILSETRKLLTEG